MAVVLISSFLSFQPAIAGGAGGEFISEPDPKRPLYEDDAGRTILGLLDEISKNYTHFRAQAEKYDLIVRFLQVVAFLSALCSAIVLVLSDKDWSRRSAIIASLLAASIPAGDQVFHTTQIQMASWKAALSLSRLHAECKDRWELPPETATQSDQRRTQTAQSLVTECRKRLSEIHDKEIDVWVNPLVVPVFPGTPGSVAPR
jgi:hypothetical protein